MDDNERTKDNQYYEFAKHDKRYADSTSPIHDQTRLNWKPFGNYKGSTMEEIAKKGKRL
jgi:hypothetical protein